MYEHGFGVLRGLQTRRQLLPCGREPGYALAQYNSPAVPELANGVKRIYRQAFDLCSKAADQNLRMPRSKSAILPVRTGSQP